MKNRFFLFLVCLALMISSTLTVFAQDLTLVGSFTYISRVKNALDQIQYAHPQWINNESQLLLASFGSDLIGDQKVLNSITVERHDIKGSVGTYTTMDVPNITNPSTDPTSTAYRYWWGVLGMVGFGKKNVVFQFHNTTGTDEYILVSYEMKAGQLVRNGQVTFYPNTTGDVTTSLKRAVVYKEAVYVVIADEVGGSVVSSIITQYDIKLNKIKKMTGSPHGKDLLSGPISSNTLPRGYWYEDYEVVNPDETWTRFIHIYKY